jgi:putative nucleotidyltransferase with HDIG domain
VISIEFLEKQAFTSTKVKVDPVGWANPEDVRAAITDKTTLVCVQYANHDIGKVAAPDHFVENQTGDNPHDRLKPIQSAKIITSHVTFGLRLAKEIGLPKRIADFIPQHHGTRALHFFLQKAKAQANGAVINEADFRYPGPKPQFKEAAILMLVDSAEAAARSPGARALAVAQDRLQEKRLALRLGVAAPRFAPVDDSIGLAAAIAAVGLPAIIKTRRMGYDGKGQARIATLETTCLGRRTGIAC